MSNNNFSFMHKHIKFDSVLTLIISNQDYSKELVDYYYKIIKKYYECNILDFKVIGGFAHLWDPINNRDIDIRVEKRTQAFFFTKNIITNTDKENMLKDYAKFVLSHLLLKKYLSKQSIDFTLRTMVFNIFKEPYIIKISKTELNNNPKIITVDYSAEKNNIINILLPSNIYNYSNKDKDILSINNNQINSNGNFAEKYIETIKTLLDLEKKKDIKQKIKDIITKAVEDSKKISYDNNSFNTLLNYMDKKKIKKILNIDITNENKDDKKKNLFKKLALYLFSTRLFQYEWKCYVMLPGTVLHNCGYSLFFKNDVDNQLLHSLLNIFNLSFSIISNQFNEKKIIKESIKSAISAIMSRNMSHNIGSHVLSYLGLKNRDYYLLEAPGEDDNSKKTIDERDIYNYLRERMDFIAEISSSEPGNETNFKFVKEIVEPFLYNIPLIDNITYSENIKATNISFNIIIKKGDKKRTYYYNYDFNNDLSKDSPENKGNNNKPNNENSEIEDVEVSIPNGNTGIQAFYAMLENIIRNCAKHRKKEEKNDLILTIEITDKKGEDSIDYNFYHLKIYDNFDNSDQNSEFESSDGNKVSGLKKDEFINRIIQDYIIKETGELHQKYFGIKELKICAAYLQGKSLLNAGYENLNVEEPEKMDNEESVKFYATLEQKEYLCYNLKLRKPQFALFVGFKFNDELKEGLLGKGIITLKFDNLEIKNNQVKYKLDGKEYNINQKMIIFKHQKDDKSREKKFIEKLKNRPIKIIVCSDEEQDKIFEFEDKVLKIYGQECKANKGVCGENEHRSLCLFDFEKEKCENYKKSIDLIIRRLYRIYCEYLYEFFKEEGIIKKDTKPKLLIAGYDGYDEFNDKIETMKFEINGNNSIIKKDSHEIINNKDNIMLLHRHGEQSDLDPEIKSEFLYYEDYSGSDTISIYIDNILKCEDEFEKKKMILTLIEMALTSIVVIDERIYEEITFRDELKKKNIFIFENIASAIDRWSSNSETGSLKNKKLTFLVIHQGVIDKENNNFYEDEKKRTIKEEIKNKFDYIVIETGRGSSTLDLPEGCLFAQYSDIIKFLRTINKLDDIRVLYSLGGKQ